MDNLKQYVYVDINDVNIFIRFKNIFPYKISINEVTKIIRYLFKQLFL